MSKFMMMICCVCAHVVMADITDIQLREILERAVSYIDDPDGGPCEVQYAIQVSGGDTNRVVSMMKQLIDEGTRRDGISRFYISQIGRYGTTSDLPFLYQRVATSNLCVDAVDALLKIEGISTGSVSRVCALLESGNPTNRYVASAWITLAAEVREKCADPIASHLVLSNVIEYASRQNVYADMIDRSIMRLDPGYRMSRRRLAAMRAITSLGVHPSRTNYVNSVIHELESYPEANLPE